MEARNAVIVALLIDALAVAAALLPGAGSTTYAVAGIGVCLSGALLLMAGLSWRWRDAAPAEEAERIDLRPDADSPAALAG